MQDPKCGYYFLLTKTFFYYESPNQEISEQASHTKINPRQYNSGSLRRDSTGSLYRLRQAAILATIQNGTQTICMNNWKNRSMTLQWKLRVKNQLQLGHQETPPGGMKAGQYYKGKKKAYNKWVTTKQNGNRKDYKHRPIIIQSLKTKIEHWERVCEKMYNCAENTKINKAWRILKTLRTQNKDKARLDSINLSTWTKPYKTLLTKDMDVFLGDLANHHIEMKKNHPFHCNSQLMIYE